MKQLKKKYVYLPNLARRDSPYDLTFLSVKDDLADSEKTCRIQAISSQGDLGEIVGVIGYCVEIQEWVEEVDAVD